MQSQWYPLTFKPVYKDYIWGGTRIAQRYGRRDAPARCAESWECSTRPEGMSGVRDGPWHGRTLAELIENEDRTGLLGTAPNGTGFPLLLKIIDAQKRLSVQVHPDESSAATVGGEPKTEAWYILAAEPGACLYSGLQPGVSREQLRKAAADPDPADMLQLLKTQAVTAGDVIFVPGGRVHAIGEGILLLEVQQSSDTTFRLYDWGRVGSDGKPRPLHIDEALATIDWEDRGRNRGATISLQDFTPQPGIFQPRVECRWFIIEQITLNETRTIENDGTSFHALFAAEGDVTAATPRGQTDVPAGTTLLMPAALARYTLQPATESGDTQLIRIRVPRSRGNR